MIWAPLTLAFFAFLMCSELTYPGVHTCSSMFNLTFCPSLACPPVACLLPLNLQKWIVLGQLDGCQLSFFVMPCVHNATTFSPSQTKFGAIVLFPIRLLPHLVLYIYRILQDADNSCTRVLRVTAFL